MSASRAGSRPSLSRAYPRRALAALAEQLAGRAAGQQAHLQRAGYLGDVVGVDAGRGFGVEAGQQAVQGAAAARLAGGQPVAQGLVAGRPLEESIHQRAQIEAGSARYDGQPAAPGDAGDGLAGQPGILARGKDAVGIADVYEVVRDAAPLRLRELGRPDIEPAVHLERIAVHDFAVEPFGERQRQIAFSRAGGTNYRNQRAPRGI